MNSAPRIERLLGWARTVADDDTEPICRNLADKVFRVEPLNRHMERVPSWAQEQC